MCVHAQDPQQSPGIPNEGLSFNGRGIGRMHPESAIAFRSVKTAHHDKGRFSIRAFADQFLLQLFTFRTRSIFPGLLQGPNAIGSFLKGSTTGHRGGARTPNSFWRLSEPEERIPESP